jgi:hypothetical protein
MSQYVPKVGDVVRLNAHGLTQVGGLKTPEQVDAQVKGSRVLAVTRAAVEPEVVYDVDLEGPFFPFLLTNYSLEPVDE